MHEEDIKAHKEGKDVYGKDTGRKEIACTICTLYARERKGKGMQRKNGWKRTGKHKEGKEEERT